MRASTLIPALLASVAAAVDTSTIYMFFPDADTQTLDASVIDVTASTTRYLVGCPSTVAADDCGFDPPETVMHAGSVYGASVSFSGSSISYECTLFTTGKTSAVCETGGTTATLEASDITFQPVTITAGVSKLVSAAATAATVTLASASGSGKVTLVGSSVVTSASSTSTTSTSGSGSAASAGTTSATSTGGVATMGLGLGAAGVAALALAL